MKKEERWRMKEMVKKIYQELILIRKELQVIRNILEPHKDYKYVRENGRATRKQI